MQNAWRGNRVLVVVVTFVLWLATAALGLWQIVLVRDMFFRIYARFVGGGEGFQGTYWAGTSAAMLLVILLSVVWIAVVIGGAEYHYRHVGQKGSWKLLGWVITIELAILLLALFI